LSGILSQLEPHYPDVHHSWNSSLVKCTLQGALCAHGHPTKCKEALCHDDLIQVLCNLEHPLTHDNLLWVTQLHCSFYGLLHLGELVAPDERTLQDYTKFSEQFSVTVSDTDEGTK
jgi:hypothetical protein